MSIKAGAPFKRSPSFFLSFSATAFKKDIGTVDVYRLLAVDLAELDAIQSIGLNTFLRGGT